MLENDMEILDELINDQSVWSNKRDALKRIKKELVESSKTPDNKQSESLLCKEELDKIKVALDQISISSAVIAECMQS